MRLGALDPEASISLGSFILSHCVSGPPGGSRFPRPCHSGSLSRSLPTREKAKEHYQFVILLVALSPSFRRRDRVRRPHLVGAALFYNYYRGGGLGPGGGGARGEFSIHKTTCVSLRDGARFVDTLSERTGLSHSVYSLL